MSLIKEFAEKVVQRAKLNLGVTQTRYGVKSNWSKGKPSAFKKHQFKSRIVATGTLKNSIGFRIKEKATSSVITFSMAPYGIYVEEGRQGKKDVFKIGKNSQAKGAPVSAIQKWLKSTNAKPRDEEGRFIKKTKANMNSMAYLINRKIKWFGIAPSNFMQNAFTQTLKEYEDDIPKTIIAKLFK